MDLILWRHAEADEVQGTLPDAERGLTARGHANAAKMANWLKHQHMKNVLVLAGPSKRTRQTAEALGLPVKVKAQLGVGAHAVDLLGAAEWPDRSGAVILVSHQPALGRLASLLLSGTEANWTIKKGGVWWFSNRVRADETQTVLRAVCNP